MAKKKSIIKKSITRKLSTAQYETLDVTVEATEEIEWDTVEERMNKTTNITSVVLIDFQNTLTKALGTMNLDKKLAEVNSFGNK
ncbi:MAG: hypothetical protein J7L15_02905 [Clostridiales bacterium]|nr:hypothetical protein [Clostridiales bacterium]